MTTPLTPDDPSLVPPTNKSRPHVVRRYIEFIPAFYKLMMYVARLEYHNNVSTYIRALITADLKQRGLL